MKFKFSSIAIGTVAFACLLIDFSLKNWKKQERVIEYDIHSYYAYLPAFFIYDDIKLEKSSYKYVDNYYLFWPTETEGGKKIIKTSLGLSILYAPFFFVAHALAFATDYPEDGFSEPYKLFLLLSTIFYLIIGLDFTRKILSRLNFPNKHISIVILLIGLGTNLLCYASQSAPMSHAYSYCLFAIFIYYTIKWYASSSLKNTFVIGLLFGLISLIRPTNFVLLIFFFLYNISGVREFKQRIFFFIGKWRLVFAIAIVAFLVWVPQFIYWKIVTGKFLVYSYPGEGFFFSHPRILEGLFSWRKGWLVYTPMMAFALAGIFFLKNELKKLRLAIVLFMLANIYIIFSWWCWWYGGTLGQRSFIESYALLAIPFASFIKFISDRKWFCQLLFYCVAIFLIWLNIFQTYQFEFHSLHHDGMTRELYFKQFGKMEKVEGFDSMVHWPNYDAALKGEDCETPPSENNNQNNMQQNNLHLWKKETGRKTILLKAYNGKFVCADANINHIVIANRDSALGWETFSLLFFEKNECAIQAYDNHFFYAELGSKNEITATREKIADWETFSLVKLDSNFVAFKAANGKYISLDEKSSQLFARSDSIGRKERFEIIIK